MGLNSARCYMKQSLKMLMKKKKKIKESEEDNMEIPETSFNSYAVKTIEFNLKELVSGGKQDQEKTYIEQQNGYDISSIS